MADDIADAAAAASSARKWAALTIACVVVAIAVLLVDNQIKRHVIAKAAEMRRTVDEFGGLVSRVGWVYAAGAEVSVDGQEQAEPAASDDGSPGDPGPDSGAGVVSDAPGRADVDQGEPVGEAVQADWPRGRAGLPGGPRGDG